MSFAIFTAPVRMGATFSSSGRIEPLMPAMPVPSLRESIDTSRFTTHALANGAVILRDGQGNHCGTFTSGDLAASTVKFLGTP